MERIIYNRIINYLNAFNVLCDNQYGFRKNRSPSLALIDLYDKVSSAFDRREHAISLRQGGGGGGGRCLQGNLWYSPPASMTSRLASVTFKMTSKVFIEETDKNIDFITEILFRFLEFGDFKVSIVIEN